MGGSALSQPTTIPRQCFFTVTLKADIVKTHKFLKNNQQIKVIFADKSNKTVIINAADYSEKMNNLLCDTNIYKPIKNSLRPSQTGKNNCIIKNWFKNNFIGKFIAESLTVKSAMVSRVYGLIELHKEGFPMRPIVSTINSPYYAVSRYFTSILNKIVGNTEFHVKNSFQFFSEINSIVIPEDFRMISLEVVSIYTNISVDRVNSLNRA